MTRNTSQKVTGSCLCGSVKFEIQGELKHFQYCHCHQCQKSSGNAFATNLFAKPEQLQWLQGEDALQYFPMPGRKYYASQFCKTCGSKLPWPTQDGRNVIVPAGSLDTPLAVKPQQHIFVESNPQWFDIHDDLPQHQQLPQKN